MAYRTVNLHRSAIAFHIPSLNGVSIGATPIVTKFMKGVFNLNPPKPRYVETWDPAVLLSYIDGLGNNSDLSLNVLTKKLVCLLALTKASRSSDICALDLSGYRKVNNGVLFSHVHLRKTSRPGHLPEAFYPSFSENERLCVVHTLDDYVKITEPLRSTSTTKLIISTRKPYKEASSSTVSRWILDFMKCSGIDTDKFKSHSVRGASTSKAYKNGVSISDVQKAADWKSSHTFMRFYFRHANNSTFGSSVLSSSK